MLATVQFVTSSLVPHALRAGHRGAAASPLLAPATKMATASLSSAARMSVASDLVAAELVAAAASQGSVSFWPLLVAFVSGGLFFSTAVTAAAAVYAFGLDNCRRITAVLLLVAQRVLKLIGAMVQAT